MTTALPTEVTFECSSKLQHGNCSRKALEGVAHHALAWTRVLCASHSVLTSTLVMNSYTSFHDAGRRKARHFFGGKQRPSEVMLGAKRPVIRLSTARPTIQPNTERRHVVVARIVLVVHAPPALPHGGHVRPRPIGSGDHAEPP